MLYTVGRLSYHGGERVETGRVKALNFWCVNIPGPRLQREGALDGGAHHVGGGDAHALTHAQGSFLLIHGAHSCIRARLDLKGAI